jgi:hypothetical protein
LPTWWSVEVTKQEFRELAEAYGADLARWPTALRDEAALLVATEAAFAQDVLTREARLDAALDELPRAPASSELFERIVASAPPLRRRRRWRLWLAPAGLSAALAGIAAAGVLIGVQISEHSAVNSETTAQAVADLDISAVAEEG